MASCCGGARADGDTIPHGIDRRLWSRSHTVSNPPSAHRGEASADLASAAFRGECRPATAARAGGPRLLQDGALSGLRLGRMPGSSNRMSLAEGARSGRCNVRGHARWATRPTVSARTPGFWASLDGARGPRPARDRPAAHSAGARRRHETQRSSGGPDGRRPTGHSRTAETGKHNNARPADTASDLSVVGEPETASNWQGGSHRVQLVDGSTR